MMPKSNSSIGNICMLSTHGYFDPVPQLGRTDTGGQVVYVLELAKCLAAQGRKVDIYTRWFDQKAEQIDPVPGHPDVRVIRIPAGPWEFLAKEHIYDVLPELSENMISLIKEHGFKYDLYHGHYVDAGIVTLDVAAAMNKPAFFTAHSIGAWKRQQMEGDPVEMEKKYKFEHRVAEETRIFKSVLAQSVTTPLQQEKLDELYGWTADNIVVIPPGVDVHHFVPCELNDPKPRADLPEKYVFCLSRIDANKGHDLLLNAFDFVRKEISDVDLVIGGGSPKPQAREKGILDNIRSTIDENGMKNRAHVIGYVPDEQLASLYQQAEMFVLPSIFEPFGMTALEAMACGTPVVASKFGGIKNVINSGQNGILTDVSKPEEFAESVIAMLKDRSYADKLGQAGLKTVREQYSWEAIADRHIDFYKRFMKV